MKKTIIATVVFTALILSASTLKIGWGKADVTPLGPTMLQGQRSNRLAAKVLDPLSTTVLALDNGKYQLMMISLDNCGFRPALLAAVRKSISKRIRIAPEKIIGFATHTHTAPQYGAIVPMADCMKLFKAAGKGKILGKGNCGIDVAEMKKKYPDFVDSEMYFHYLVKQITSAAVQAWNSRAAGKIAYGMGSAAIGECRRLTMANEGGRMYGFEDSPQFLHAEGHVDNSLNVIATYTPCGKLTGLILNLACPSQVSEALRIVSADFWHEVREGVAARYGKNVYILPQCSPAGDISPHKILNRRADQRMMLLRQQQNKALPDWKWATRVYDQEYGLARRKEIARRIMTALDDVLPVIASTGKCNVEFKHSFRILELPPRLITAAEAKQAEEQAKHLEEVFKKAKIAYDGSLPAQLGVIERYKNPPENFRMELHSVRLGEVAFATNPFELYLDYGDRIKGGSKAVQTFLIQLANGSGGYLPSQRSGTAGYGSWPSSCRVNFDGGHIIVRESIKDINAMF